jgi:hypothetical protein
MGENVNSNLIMLPNSPNAGSDMLSQMTASFIASQKMGEDMKEATDALKARKLRDKQKIELKR